jgi:hypothetical protein
VIGSVRPLKSYMILSSDRREPGWFLSIIMCYILLREDRIFGIMLCFMIINNMFAILADMCIGFRIYSCKILFTSSICWRLLFNEYQCYFPGMKRPGRDVDHSLPPNAEVKNDWNYTSTPPTQRYSVYRKNFNFTSDPYLCLSVRLIYSGFPN